MDLYFSDVFEIAEESLDDYGAFNISLITDLPLFIDPFLLFHSQKREYQDLHNSIIKYLEFLRDKSMSGRVSEGLLQSWYYFSEIKQNWLGFTLQGNSGRGLAGGFARALDSSLARIFGSFGHERVTRGTHLEKLCLIKRGVGKDTISDFTTNLIKEYLLEYTQAFTEKKIDPKYSRRVAVSRVRFNYSTETWMPDTYTLPSHKRDHVLLTPKDILTKDDTWINRGDYLSNFHDVFEAVSNEQLRAELNNYLISVLSKKPNKEEYDGAITEFTIRHPELVDYYIKYKEDKGDCAVERSHARVEDSRRLYVEQFGNLARLLCDTTAFYTLKGDTASEARQRIAYMKDVIENKGGWKLFYIGDQPVRREEDLHVAYRLTWFGTPSDVSHEVDNGRGPADYKISRGSQDKTIVEFKLASNSQLKQNLRSQVELYRKASDARIGYKVILYFTDSERNRVQNILRELNLADEQNVILIDARRKASASRVR